MKYDFDKVIDRRSTNSLKWDVSEDELPMWVADMDFETAPEITEAIIRRAEHGAFGYADVTDAWYEAYIGWWKRRHDFDIKKEWLIFSTGVIPTISSVVRKITTPAENVLILTPVYNIFYNSILNNGRNVLECKLKYAVKESNAHLDYDTEYIIDFTDLENKLADPQTTLMLLCNPHNPVGKIWDRATLERIGSLCMKYNVTVLSDEIHCDLTKPDKEYVPFASVSEELRNISITCIAPTKAFNLAGLQTSAVVVPNPALRHKVWRGLNTDEVGEPNVFAIEAAVAAFTEGALWLDELRRYIYENKSCVKKFLENELKELRLVESEATYLLWIDCSKIEKENKEGQKRQKFSEFLRKETGLYISAGEQYGSGGEHFIRLNAACPRTTLRDGLERLKKGVMLYIR